MKDKIKDLKELLHHKSKKTRNMMLFLAVTVVIAILIINALGLLGTVLAQSDTVWQTEPTITTSIISFFKWLVASGATITCVKTLKGKTNSDDVEDDLSDDISIDSENESDSSTNN